MRAKEELLQLMSDSVLEMEEEDTQELCQEYVEAGYPALEGIMSGLVDGMNRASALYDEQEYFVTDLLLCSDAMYVGLDVLRPHLPEESGEAANSIVIGVVEGDTHDIGKNLVKILLETAGFNMIDLGRDVPLQSFIDAAKEHNAHMVCLSTLMTTTMGGMETIVNMLVEEGIRDQVKVLIGGGPISQSYCNKIGADGYADNAVGAVKLAKSLLGVA